MIKKGTKHPLNAMQNTIMGRMLKDPQQAKILTSRFKVVHWAPRQLQRAAFLGRPLPHQPSKLAQHGLGSRR